MRPDRRRGFTLIEALVSVLVLTVGLLGISSLQMVNLRKTGEGFLRSQATAIANDMAERIRANPVAVKRNDFADLQSRSVCAGSFTGPHCASASADCSVSELARYDFYTAACGNPVYASGNRYSGANNLLPAGQMNVSCTDPGVDPDVICSISVSWREEAEIGSGSTGALTRQVALRIQP